VNRPDDELREQHRDDDRRDERDDRRDDRRLQDRLELVADEQRREPDVDRGERPGTIGVLEQSVRPSPRIARVCAIRPRLSSSSRSPVGVQAWPTIASSRCPMMRPSTSTIAAYDTPFEYTLDFRMESSPGSARSCAYGSSGSTPSFTSAHARS
jgi:hypothetical protein